MDSAYPVIVVAPVVGLIANCVAQVTLAKAFPARGPYGSLATGILVGFVVSAAFTAGALQAGGYRMTDCIAFHVLNVCSYLALAFGYFNFVNLTIASLRIRLLGELKAAGGALDRSRLLESYDTRKVIDLRIDRLVRGGHLRETDGFYSIGKRRFLAVALVYDCLRRLVIGAWPRNDADGQAGDGRSRSESGTSSAKS